MDEQQITFSVGDKGGVVDPDAVIAAMRAVLETLKSVDANMWPVRLPRFRWGILTASKASPLTVTMRAELAIPDARTVDVVHWTMEGWRALSNSPKKPPRYFSESDLDRAKMLADLRVQLKIIAPGEPEVAVTPRISANVERFLKPTQAAPNVEYGSIEGTLRQVTVDDRDEHRTSQFQIIERYSGALVACRFNPADAQKVGAHIRSRIVVFGEIRYSPIRVPKHVDVRNYRIIPPDDQLPDLRDIQKLRLRTEGDADPADFIRDLREGNVG